MSAKIFPLIEWIVTWRCEGRCFYCYQKDKKSLSCPEVSTERVHRVLGELGARRIIITGGEPLLHEGIEQFVIDCSEEGIETELLTRRIPSKAFLKRASSSLIHLHLGVDTLCQTTATRMGSPLLSPSELYLAAQSASTLTIRTVVTSWNSDEIPALTDRLIEMGVRSFQFIFPQDPVTGKAMRLAGKTLTRLGQIFTFLLGQGMELQVQYPRSPCKPPCNRPKEVCMAGRRSVSIFPDGSVGLCQHLPGRLLVGSVNSSPVVDTSLIEHFLRPPRSLFHETPCAVCTLFEHCNETGRCWLSSHRAGNLFGPDCFCPRGETVK